MTFPAKPPQPAAAPEPTPPVIPRMELDEDLPPLVPLDDGSNRPFQVVEGDLDVLDEVLPVGDGEGLQELDDLEEVEEPDDRPRRRRSWLDESRLLRLRRIYVRGHDLSLGDALTGQNESIHDLIDPLKRRRLGKAIEVRDTTTSVLRHIVHSEWLAVQVEIREQGELLAVIHRPPHLTGIFGRATLEIQDVDGQVLGVFEDRPWGNLFSRPMWITDCDGNKLLQIQSHLFQGRMDLLTARGRPVGMVRTGRLGERFRIALVRSMSYTLSFTEALDDRPEDKLRFLAAVIGLFLFVRDRA
jgi:hypothetical protein